MLRLIFALGLWVAASASVCAQVLPNHADPSAREQSADLTDVPAIRFLTSTGFPPLNYRDGDGRLVGFHIDLASAICDVVGVTCTVQAWPWEQAADALGDNQGDALIAGLAITPENGERFDFSDIYLMLPGRFVVKQTRASAFDVSALGDARVSVRAGSAHGRFLAEILPDVTVTPFGSEIEALNAVQTGAVDAYFGDAMRASFWLNQNTQCCVFAGEAYFNAKMFGEGLAIALPAGQGAVRTTINFALDRLKRSGKLDELYLRWFPISFY